MAFAEALSARAGSPSLERLLRRPERGAAIIVALAWATLIVRGTAGMATGMDGMSMHDSAPVRGLWPALAAGLPGWMLMTVAMMGPAALPAVRHTGVNSLRWRRARAMTEFSLAYLAVWFAFGVAALEAAALVPGVPGSFALALVLGAAAAWQLTPLKRRSLRDCHRSTPLPPTGWRAEIGALRFGVRNGRACLGSCWCLMLIMAVAPGDGLLWMVTITGIGTTERLLDRPRPATRHAATVLGFAAFTMAAVALASQ